MDNVTRLNPALSTRDVTDNVTTLNPALTARDVTNSVTAVLHNTGGIYQLTASDVAGIHILLMCIGVPANALVFVLTSENKLAALSYPIYLNCLALSDSLVLIIKGYDAIMSLPMIIFPDIYENIPCWLRCVFVKFPIITSPWLLVGLSLDRCICICHPMIREKFCTRRKAYFFCCCVLAVSLLITSRYIADDYPDYVFSQCYLKNSSFQSLHVTATFFGDLPCFLLETVKVYHIIIRIMAGPIPCLFLFVLNVRIIVYIRKSNRFRNKCSLESTQGKISFKQTKSWPSLLVSFCALVTLLPISVWECVYLYIPGDDTTWAHLMNARYTFLTIYTFNFAQNFFVLLASSANYRHILKTKLQCCCVLWRRNAPN